MHRLFNSQSRSIEDMPKDDEGNEAQEIEVQGNEIQEVEVETTQPLPKDWRYNPHHPKDLISVSYTHLTLPTKRIV